MTKRFAYLTCNLLSTAAITNATICTIPDIALPKNAVTTYGYQAGSTARTITLNKNGTVVGTMAPNTVLHFNAAYIMADNQEQPWA